MFRIVSASGGEVPGAVMGLAKQKAAQLVRIGKRPAKNAVAYSAYPDELYISVIQLGQTAAGDLIIVLLQRTDPDTGNPTTGKITKSHIAAGGFVFGGAATVNMVANHIASGGFVFGGSAAVNKVANHIAAGGFVFGGAATVNMVANHIASGGFVFGGSAALERIYAQIVVTVTISGPLTYGNPISNVVSATETPFIDGTWLWSTPLNSILPAGTYDISATFTPTDKSHLPAWDGEWLVVNKANPVITWADPAAITYGTALSGTQLNATANIPGTFVYDPPVGTVPDANSGLVLNVTFYPTDSANYNNATDWAGIVVGKANPVITWNTPAAITYGTALSGVQQNATADVAGTFTYNNPSGTVFGAGWQYIGVTFTPSNSVDYNTATKWVWLLVNKAASVVSWSTPAAITYGTALTTAQLNATANVPGTFSYNPPLGTVLGAGSQALSVTFYPNDSTNYSSDSDGVWLQVNAQPAVITWGTPAAITYGTALSATQLNATANVAGTFSYSPAAGTVLGAGSQALSVTFTPSDPNYSSDTDGVWLTVNKANTSVSWNDHSLTYGTALTSAHLDATASVPGSFIYHDPGIRYFNIGEVVPAGVYSVEVAFYPTDSANYNPSSDGAWLTVGKATPSITWADPAAITYGTALSATQLNATANVAGTFSYSPAAGTVPGANSGLVLSVTFTPSDSSNYDSASDWAGIVVNKAPQTIAFVLNDTDIYVGQTAYMSLTTVNQAAGAGGVSYSSGNSGVASVSGSSVYGASAGAVYITVIQAATANFNQGSFSVYLNVHAAVSFWTKTLDDCPGQSLPAGFYVYNLDGPSGGNYYTGNAILIAYTGTYPNRIRWTFIWSDLFCDVGYEERNGYTNFVDTGACDGTAVDYSLAQIEAAGGNGGIPGSPGISRWLFTETGILQTEYCRNLTNTARYFLVRKETESLG